MDQYGEITDNWAKTYFVRIDLAFFPARCIMEVHDLSHRKAWVLDNFLFDFRSAQDAINITIPQEKWWSSRLKTCLKGKLNLIAPKETPGIREKIEITAHLSWYPGWISLEWHEDQTFIRLTTRSPPSQGHWEQCDFDQGLLHRFKPLEVPPKPRDPVPVPPRPSVPASSVPSSNPIITETEPQKSPRPNVKPMRDQANEPPPGDDNDLDGDLKSLVSDSDEKTSSSNEKEDDHRTIAKPPVPPVVDRSPPPEKDLPPNTSEVISEPANVEDHFVSEETVVTPMQQESEPIVGPAPPPEAIATTPPRGKGYPAIPEFFKAAFNKGMKAGKGMAPVPSSVIAMQNLQSTLGIPPLNETELYQRQVWAQAIPELHPSLYNWLVFARSPTVVPTAHVELFPNAQESIAGDAEPIGEQP